MAAMAANENPAAAGETVFRFGAPIVGTEHPKDVWRPGATATAGSRSLLHDDFYADPVIRPAVEPFNRSGWPGLC
jgi:hypothetical protein